MLKAKETPEQRRKRRLAKKEEKEKKYDRLKGVNDLGYSNTDNPFGDTNLTDNFIWKKVCYIKLQLNVYYTVNLFTIYLFTLCIYFQIDEIKTKYFESYQVISQVFIHTIHTIILIKMKLYFNRNMTKKAQRIQKALHKSKNIKWKNYEMNWRK